MDALVYVHVEFLRKDLSTDSALITHGMFKKSPSLLPQAGQVDLADLYAISCSRAFPHTSLKIEYFFFEEFEFMFLDLVKLESLFPGVGLPAARLAALVNLIEFPIFHD